MQVVLRQTTRSTDKVRFVLDSKRGNEKQFLS